MVERGWNPCFTRKYRTWYYCAPDSDESGPKKIIYLVILFVYGIKWSSILVYVFYLVIYIDISIGIIWKVTECK